MQPDSGPPIPLRHSLRTLTAPRGWALAWAIALWINAAPSLASTGQASAAASQPSALSAPAAASSKRDRAASGPAVAPQAGLELLMALVDRAQDNPRAAREEAMRVHSSLRQQGRAEEAVWALLAATDAALLMHQIGQARALFDQAQAEQHALKLQAPGLQAHLMLRHWRVYSPAMPPADAARRQVALRANLVALGDEAAPCQLSFLDAQALLASESVDEAAFAADEARDCAEILRRTGLYALATALHNQAMVQANPDSANVVSARTAILDLIRSRSPMGGRHLMGSLLHTLAGIEIKAKAFEEALKALAEAALLFEQVDSPLDVALVRIAQARAFEGLDQHRQALTALERAAPDVALLPINAQAAWHEMHLNILSTLKDPRLAQAVEEAAHLNATPMLPGVHRRLNTACAHAYAATGRYSEAYDALRRNRELRKQAERLATDWQAMRLQSRHALAEQRLELTKLRLQATRAQAVASHERAEQRLLWALAVGAMVLLAGLAALVRHLLKRQHRLAQLGFRDAATGMPDRRAIHAYAAAQCDQAERLHLPLWFAVVEIDHFARIAQTWGDPTAKAMRQGLAQAAAVVLHGAQRMGSLNACTWFIVLPGADAQQVQELFERLSLQFAQTPVDTIPEPHRLTLSMGAVAWKRPAGPLVDSLEGAQAQLAEAKAAGGGRLGLQNSPEHPAAGGDALADVMQHAEAQRAPCASETPKAALV